MHQDYNNVLDECALINTRRLYYLSLISIPIRLANIYVFINNDNFNTASYKVWSQGIIASHLILFFFMIGLFILTYKLRNRENSNAVMHVLQYTAIFVILAMGIIIVSLDQLVTTNITPFLITTTVIGLVFIIRPLISFLVYTASYIGFYYLIALYATNEQILLSNRVNGITAVGLGFLLSIIIWNYNYTNIVQKRRIEKQQKQMEKMAYYDLLTDLPNRRFFYQLFQKEISLIKRHGYEAVVMIMDVDNFKEINDTYGHPTGDNVLKQLADLLKNNVRESDTVSRFGGEEFIIMLPNTSLEQGCAFAERLRTTIMNNEFTVDSNKFRVTSSFGVCLINREKILSLEECYHLVDKALYLAKQKGKNKIEVVANENMRLENYDSSEAVTEDCIQEK